MKAIRHARIVSSWDATSQRHRSSPPVIKRSTVVFLQGVFRLIGKRRCAKGPFCARGKRVFRSVLGGLLRKGKTPPLFPQGLGISRKSTIESSQQDLISTAKLEAFKHMGTQVAFPCIPCSVVIAWFCTTVGTNMGSCGSQLTSSRSPARPQLPRPGLPGVPGLIKSRILSANSGEIKSLLPR